MEDRRCSQRKFHLIWVLMGVKMLASITTTELYGGKKENEVSIYVTLNENGKLFLRTSIIRLLNQYTYSKVVSIITVEKTNEGVNLRLRSSSD